MADTLLSDRTIEGYLIRYNSLSLPIQMPNGRKVYEQILPGAFAESVDAIKRSEYSISVNVEHEENALMQIGTTATNVQLENRPDGVFMRMQLLDESVSNDLFKRIKAQIVKGLSVEFKPYVGEEASYQAVNGDYVRSWKRLKLTGFAVTAKPMYPDAQITKAETATPSTFARSIDKAELAQIQDEVDRLNKSEVQKYEYEAFILGIKL